MLHRGKGIDFLSHRKHDNTSRMLSGRTPYPDTSLHNPVYLTVTLSDSTLFIIIFDITECRLIRKRTDCSGFKGLSLAEDNLRIFMCLTLVLSGEV